jgi:hypothetical protein
MRDRARELQSFPNLEGGVDRSVLFQKLNEPRWGLASKGTEFCFKNRHPRSKLEILLADKNMRLDNGIEEKMHTY